MIDAPERFGSLLQEKLDELDAAVAAEALLRNDPIERLRLHAAHLITGVIGGPWATGATIRFQMDPAEARVAPPALDMHYPPLPRPVSPPPAALPAPNRRGPHGLARRRVP